MFQQQHFKSDHSKADVNGTTTQAFKLSGIYEHQEGEEEKDESALFGGVGAARSAKKKEKEKDVV